MKAALLLLALLACGAHARLLLDDGATATGTATGTSAAIHTQAISATDPNSGMAINTALATGTAQDGSVVTGAAVQGTSGSSLGAGTTAGGASGEGTSSSTSAITSLVTPDSATVGGFTNAVGSRTAASDTTVYTLADGKEALTTTQAKATSLDGLLAAAGTSGKAAVSPLGGEAVGTLNTQADGALTASKIRAIFTGEQGQALARLVAEALAAQGVSSVTINADGSAQGSQSATVISDASSTAH